MTYGSHVVAAGASSDPYGQRYKGIWICLELLKRALAGNYVNFGVFELYGDPALKVRLSADLPIIEGTKLYMSLLSPCLRLRHSLSIKKAKRGNADQPCAARWAGQLTGTLTNLCFLLA